MIPDTKTRVQIAVSYLTWVILSGGAFLILLAGRASLLEIMARTSAVDFQHRFRMGMLDKGFFLFAGIAAVSFCIAMEVSLTNAPSWRVLAIKSLRYLGIELLIISGITATSQIAGDALFASLLFAAVVILPLLAGGILIAISVLVKRRVT